LLLGAVILTVVSTIGATLPLLGASVRVAEATVAQSDKDSKDNKDKNKNQGDDRDEDHVLNGQVLEIDTLKDPPEVIIGSVDGLTVIRVLKTDEIATNGVHLGDYIQANGEKQNEQLFDATELSVSERYKGEDPNSNDNKKKK